MNTAAILFRTPRVFAHVPGSPSDLNTGNGTEGAMVCTSLGSLLRPLFYFLCSNLKANPVVRTILN